MTLSHGHKCKTKMSCVDNERAKNDEISKLYGVRFKQENTACRRGKFSLTKHSSTNIEMIFISSQPADIPASIQVRLSSCHDLAEKTLLARVNRP